MAVTNEFGMPQSGYETDYWWGKESGTLPAGANRYGRLPGDTNAGVLTVDAADADLSRFGRVVDCQFRKKPMKTSIVGEHSRDEVTKRIQAWDFEGRIEWIPMDQGQAAGLEILSSLVRCMGSDLTTTDDGGQTQNPWGTDFAPLLRGHVPSWFMERKIHHIGASIVKSYTILAGNKTNEYDLEVTPGESVKISESFYSQDATKAIGTTERVAGAQTCYAQNMAGQAFSSSVRFANTIGDYNPDQYAAGDATANIVMPIEPAELAASDKPYQFFESGVQYFISTIGDDYATQKTNVEDDGIIPLNLIKWKWSLRNNLERRRAPNSLGRRYCEQLVEQKREITVDLSFDMLDDVTWSRNAFDDDKIITLKLDLGTSLKSLYCRNGVMEDPNTRIGSEARKNEQSIRLVFTDPAKTRNHVTVEAT